MLLATGIVDVHPKLEQLEKAIGEGSIRYCPLCDGFEALDRRIPVLGDGEDASSKAKFLRTYSRDVPWLWQKEKPRARTALDDDFAMQLVNAVSNVTCRPFRYRPHNPPP